ncbi:MAG: undecaprenyl/decaprenyl-phosphate alpha-N-acetylglucosaminyl 1-phosphate transferase [Coriobacteriales bacterium]|nr:undecaprenyl/decaprenyl-phosphate alpha-N-acetylglucosaminyl 1-phosphate transferase [Coriobacteriales bacterium]
MAWYSYVLVCAVAALGTAVAAPLVIRIASKFDVIDYPDGRRVNTSPTPRLGGVALFFGIALALAAFLLLEGDFDPAAATAGTAGAVGAAKGINYLGATLAVVVIFAVGVIDDFKDIKARYKLLGQIVAAGIAAASGVLFDSFTNPFTNSIVELGAWAYPITVFYLVAFANIINLIDGLDGLAAGIVAISAVALFLLSIGKGGFDAAILALAIIGACMAFLFYNSHPAKLFMGDSGSLLLGFALGLVSLFGVVRTPALITLLIPVVIAGIPVLDTLAAIIRRLRAGKSVISADAEHMHHRFIDFGLDQRTTVLIMYALSALLSIAALAFVQYEGVVRWVIFFALIALIILLVWRLGLMKSVLKHHYNKRNEEQNEQNEPKG